MSKNEIQNAEKGYMVLAESSVAELLEQNMGPGGVSTSDLFRVKIPSGGGIAWEIEDENGEPMPVKEISGVILAHQDVRAYYDVPFDKKKADEISDPPCTSQDGIVGIGNPGGDCSACPLSQWGSRDDGKGRGQACALRKLMVILPEDQMLPSLISIPPASLKNAKRHMAAMASRGLFHYQVVTRLTLKKVQNQGGIDYSEVQFGSQRILSSDEVATILGYKDALMPAFKRAKIDQEDATS